ncbi:MAG: hypothetical protein DRN96_04005 [Thermoproteota archaeon]|nr:MAG: hypothetical protein DRN96_04005 [Candidatus Korarchaeota archaeon]RLG56127.1 MAG: hypothetical protein DRN99_00540 [Candidatus Korarchaeota archaeon]
MDSNLLRGKPSVMGSTLFRLGEEEAIRRLVSIANAHLPAEFKTLRQLLDERDPKVLCRDGSVHMFDRKELEKLAEMVPREMHDRLKLPIVLTINPKYGRGAYEVEGDAAKQVVAMVLDLPQPVQDEKLILYRPQVMRLRRVLPTTTQYAFAREAMW